MSEAIAESSTSDNDSCRLLDESDSSSDENNEIGPRLYWLDTEALKPFLKVEDVQSGFSALCRACHSFFRGRREADIKYKHIQFLATLRDTARRGCHLCALIRNTVDRETANHYPSNILDMHLEISRADPEKPDDSEIWYYYRKGSKRPKYGSFVQGLKTIKLVPCRLMNEPPKDRYSADSNTWSSTNRQLADQWISKCLIEHRLCNSKTAKEGWLPTRLLDIVFRDGPETVRLIETKDMISKAQYISLSHCWGRTPVLCLRAEDIAHLKNGIPLKRLPKTFRHAIEVTKYFKIKYLWIDSLCIIQDSLEDWQVESSNMRHVYQNAFCNIAATGSPNSHTGLFFERNPSLIPVGRIDAQWDGPLPQGEYCFFPQRVWSNGVSSAPLNRRAWVVQERLLARRVLHFGSQGLFFECCEHEACETFPSGLPAILSRNNSLHTFKKIYALHEDSLDNRRQSYKKWERVVQAFMRSDLTKASDKAISLSGIAEEFQEYIIKETYIAGFWKSTLAEELLWMIPRERQANGSPSTRPTQYRAPSWSWLSIDGIVHLETPMFKPTLIEVQKIHVDLLDENHTTGQIKGGYMIVRGHLLPATYRTNISFDPNTAQNYLLFNGNEIGTTTVFFDEPGKKPSEDETIFCLPIFVTPSFSGVGGLILQNTKRKEAEYTRIGRFKAKDKDVVDVFHLDDNNSKETITII